MGIAALDAVLVSRVEREIAVGVDLPILRCPGKDEIPFTGEGNGRVYPLFFAEGDRIGHIFC